MYPEDDMAFTILLYLPAPPPPPVDLTADDVQSDKVTISWKRPEYFEVDFYQIQVSAGSSNKWRNFSSVDGGKESATLGNLESETKYLIRIECGNRHGVGEIKSDVLQVETKGTYLLVYANDV